MKPTILIVDDDEEIRTQMKWALRDDYEVILAEDRPTALQQFKVSRPTVTVLDLGLPPHPNDSDEGMEILGSILALDRGAKMIVVSGQEERENALRAVGAGAHDFLCKPVDMEELRLLLDRCVFVVNIERELSEMQARGLDTEFEGMLGGSPEMQELFASIRKVAPSNAPVMVLGESGTGKEMVGRAIHNQSRLKDNPFVVINCGAIPENLLESELFGHESGVFPGADARREGLIETAAGGTLFLDEIDHLPPPVQVKLLRFLQDKVIQRVGGCEELKIDVRIIAATDADIDEAVKSGTFREDLYFRVAVVVCRVPALRNRGDDVIVLAQDFLQRFSEQNRKAGLTFAPQALSAIRLSPWPGNVRELQNRVQRAVVMADGNRVTVEDMELTHLSDLVPPRTLREAREVLDRGLVEEALRKHGGNISAASGALGISRPTFYELMDKLSIRRK